MQSADSTTSGGLASLQAVLAGLDLKPEQLDGRAKQQAAVLAFGRRTTAQPPVSVLMEDAAAMIAEVVGTDRIGVGEVVRGGAAIALRVSALDKHGVLAGAAPHEYTSEPALSMAGFALSAAAPVASPNLASEKRFSDLFLRKLGVAGALALPLFINGRPFGVLGMYAREERSFGLEDVQFAETIAHLLTSSLARIKAEEELQQERSFASALLDMVDTLVLTLDDEGRVVGMNRASRQVTGFDVEEIRQRPFWNVFVVPEELDLIRGIFRSARSERAPCEFEGFLMTKDGQKKRVSWSMKLMSDGKVQSIILSGVDQTEKIEMQSELRDAKSRAERAAKALQELSALADEKIRTRPPAEAARAASAEAEAERRPFQPLGGPVSNEQRRSIRRSYHYVQRIAPLVGDRMPRPDQFFEVQCNDISAGGISFFLDKPPAFEHLVVALGREPALSYFAADVARVASIDRGGAKSYLVGCRFTGRKRSGRPKTRT